MYRVLVLGAYGLLGCSLCEHLKLRGHSVWRQGRRPSSEICLEPTDGMALGTFFATHRVDAVVNLVAESRVDECEINPQAAYQANLRVVEVLVRTLSTSAHRPMPHLVQISTDQVYDGPGPHREDAVAPCNVYALTKLAAEYVSLQVGATVLRTNFFGRSRCTGRVSLSDWMVNSLRDGKKITVFEDVLFSALHLDTLCGAIDEVLRQRHGGIFNLGCEPGGSKAALALGLTAKLGLDPKLLTIGRAEDVPLRARRPRDMRLDTTQFATTFGFQAPTFESQIEGAAQEYRHEKTAT